jgi:hypothetical protein
LEQAGSYFGYPHVRRAEIGCAEALRRSIVSLIAKGGINVQPSTWAPFAMVVRDR